MTLTTPHPDDADTPAESLAKFHRWTHSVAGHLTNPYGALYDDVVQEGLIKGWETLERKGGRVNVAAPYLTMSMRGRMADVAHGRPMFGGDRRPGPKTEPPQTVSLDALMHNDTTGSDGEESLSGSFRELLHGPDLLDGVELAYHDGTLAQALDALPPADRQYVVLRFWHGLSDREIAAEQRKTYKFVWQRWHRTIRPRLQEALAVFGDDYY